GPKSIWVIDQPGILIPERGSGQYQLDYLPPREFDLEKAKDFLQHSDHDALVFIPTGEGWDPDFFKRNIILFGKKDVPLSMERYLEELLERKINDQKLLRQGVDPEIVAQTKTNLTLKVFNLDEDGKERESATIIKMVTGYAAGFLIYFFIFLYSSQVMRGVIEEKTSRIVEVIISSVRPFQLMMGKIVGIGSVGLLQFLIWVVLSFGIFQVVSLTILADKFDTEKIIEAQKAMGPEAGDVSALMQFQQSLEAVNFPLIVLVFLYFFIGGYILYGSLFAAIGAAVDNETDSQQFLLPVIIPLIIGILVSTRVVESPDGPLAFWFSMIPFTSPIVMMVRIPFGVPYWQLALSISLLIGTFMLTTWMAARIYRVGILMYGKKINYKEIWKWMRYH
ncbi:MAG: ABC transporter permease, partial [Bacteroidota bacterium]|nr:ABC transporter permease [Bacteroidota bacterium]